MGILGWRQTKERAAKLGWHLWGYWFHYAFGLAVVLGLAQGGMSVVVFMLATTFLAIPVGIVQMFIERRFFRAPTAPARPTPQPGDIIRDPRSGEPVINPATGSAFVVPAEVDGISTEPVLVNPATGALMVGGQGGVDVLGNPFGLDLTPEIHEGHGLDSDYSGGIDNTDTADWSGYDTSYDSYDSSGLDSGHDGH